MEFEDRTVSSGTDVDERRLLIKDVVSMCKAASEIMVNITFIIQMSGMSKSRAEKLGMTKLAKALTILSENMDFVKSVLVELSLEMRGIVDKDGRIS